MEEFLKIGILTSPHGIRGEMKVYPVTDRPEQFRKLKEVFIFEKGEYIPHEVLKASFCRERILIRLSGIPDRNTAEEYRKRELFIPLSDAPALAENEYRIGDLLGMRVLSDEGEHLGTLTDVLKTGANDVYVISSKDRRDLLIPAIRECILKADINEQKMIVHLLPGLLDL